MNKYFQSAQKYLKNALSKDATVGILVTIGFVALVVVIVLLVQSAQPKIVYQPGIACDLLTENEAKEMLGERVLHQPSANPTLQDNVATSKCSYTDQNPDQDQMLVAAIAIRSGVNDQGIEKNKREFAAAKLNQGMQAVSNIGDNAFFNPDRGQLNILMGDDWIIVSYGVGADATSNTLANARELAQKVIGAPQLPTF